MILNYQGKRTFESKKTKRKMVRFSDQFRYLSTTMNSNDLGWTILEERHDKHHHKIVRDRDRYYIAGGGIANRLFDTA